jgi:ATP-dependent RNA circularization protein (DNA/RNA ligase family)
MITEKQFDEIVDKRLTAIKETLLVKGKEYRRDNDPLHNFRKGAAITNQSEEKVLWGFATKHLVSVMDMIEDIEEYGILPKEDMLEEKIGDMINYLILLEASFKESINHL